MSRFRTRVWLLHHLREAGIKEDKLFSLFCVYIRAILEYCSPVFHPMLSVGQAHKLERLQRHTARICYGPQQSISTLINAKGIQTLAERRIARTDRFIAKTCTDPRFGPKWFTRRPQDQYGLRNRRTFEETPAKTTRLFNSPLHFFARRANELGLGCLEE